MSDNPDDPIDPTTEQPSPQPDPLEGLIEGMSSNVMAAYAPEVIAAVADLKRSDPVKFVALLIKLKKFKTLNPQAGFSVTIFQQLVDKYISATSAIIGGAGDPATRLIQLSLRADTHFLNQDNEEVWADFRVKGQLVTGRVRGPAYQRWLEREYYISERLAPGREALKAALSTIEARTSEDGAYHRLFPRVGQHLNGDGDLILCVDRGSPQRDAIEIDHEGWRLVAQAPVKFIRPEGAFGELPIPERGGNIDAMEPLLNLRSRRDFVLLIGWILGGYQTIGALAQGLFLGPHGSGKTSDMSRACSLIDPIPHADPLGPPREVREILIISQETYVQAYDNTKSISLARSGALCRLSTGSGDRGRQLYTNAGTYAMWARRPLIQTATRMVVKEPDLVDRTILFGMGSTFENENEDRRKTEAALAREYKKLWPQFLGCIFGAVAEGLRRQRADEPAPKGLPRMADFAVWSFRCEPGLGWAQGTILAAYQEAIAEYARDVVELDPVASAVFAFMLGHPDGWTGTTAELLALLSCRDGGRPSRSHDWPRDAGEMHSALQDLLIMLRRNKLLLTWRRNGRERFLTLSWIVPPPAAEALDADKRETGDASPRPIRI